MIETRTRLIEPKHKTDVVPLCFGAVSRYRKQTHTKLRHTAKHDPPSCRALAVHKEVYDLGASVHISCGYLLVAQHLVFEI